MEHKLAPIQREHILEAAKIIDREGTPPSYIGDYMVRVGVNDYHFKHLVRTAYKLATGEEVGPDFFQSNDNTREKIAKLDFTIFNRKETETIMRPFKIYKIAESASPNSDNLFSPDREYFYWNQKMFRKNEVGDPVIFINKNAPDKWALFTEISEKKIPSIYDPESNTTTFTHNDIEYSVDKEFEDFIQFRILQRIQIPNDWRWTKHLGVGETYDLWKEGIQNIPDRIDKIDDLLKIFKSGVAKETLEKYRTTLQDQMKPKPKKIDITDILEEDHYQYLISSEDFYFQKSRDLYEEFLQYQPGADSQRLLELVEEYKDTRVSFIDFLKNLSDPEEKEYFVLLGKVIANIDLHAANKNIWNLYDDKRTLARSNVRQQHWVDNLTRYKIDRTFEMVDGIRNLIDFLTNPSDHLSIASFKHRKLISENLLENKYITDIELINGLIELFDIRDLEVDNHLNRTVIISDILYEKSIRKLWEDPIKDEPIKGLVALDSDLNWIKDAMRAIALNSFNHVVIPWNNLPGGGEKTIGLLAELIEKKELIDLYVGSGNSAGYLLKIEDFATDPEEYEADNWNFNKDVAWHKNSFGEYTDGISGDKPEIVFLVSEISMLEHPIDLSDFEYSNGLSIPEIKDLHPFTNILEKPIAVNKTIHFDSEDRSILMAIKTKPFILLAGLSGTGKSRLVRKLAYHTCSARELQEDKPGNFLLVPVRPNWHDSTEILGYISRISGKPLYVSTDFLKFIVKAWKYPEVPFFLCLDEMNLAPVEQYFAEYLSLVETRRKREDGTIVTDPLLSRSSFKEESIYQDLLDDIDVKQGSALRDQFERDGLSFPVNLIVMGTVNMDETTHSFSRKVLDRAMTFEMNEIDFAKGLEEQDTAWNYPEEFIDYEVIKNEFTLGGEVYKIDKELSDEVIEYLNDLNNILDKTSFKIAYRVRDEFLIYCYHNSLLDDKPDNWFDQCLDELTLMKVISRIEGDETKVREVLSGLETFLDIERFPKTSTKLEEMIKKLKFGYTSYW